MDIHRLRVVGFDTKVRGKESEKKHIVEHENRIKEVRKTSTLENKDGNGDANQSLNGNESPPGLSKKGFENEMGPLGSSKKYLEDTPTLPGAIKICVNDERTPLTTSKQCSNGKLRRPGTSKKYQNDTPSTSHGIPKTQRSKSEIFKIPSKKYPRKHALKINSSDTGLTKLLQTSAYSHRKKRTLNLRTRSRHVRIVQKEKNEKGNKEEMHFLFARAKPSFIRDHKKRTDNERKKTKRVSKFPNDIYGFQTSNRSLNQFQYQMSHFNFIDTDKIPFKKLRIGYHRKPKPPQPVTNCFCKYHGMRVLKSACGRVDSRPIYYNLGTHPYPRRYQQKYKRDQEEGLRRERPHYMVKDEIVEVSASLFSPVPKSFHDARAGPSNVELPAGSHHRPQSLLENSTTLQNFTVASEYDQKSCPLPNVPSPYAECAVPTDRQPCELKKSQTVQDVSHMGNQNPYTPSDSPSPCSLCAARDAPAQNKCTNKRKKKKKPILIMTLFNGFLSRLEKITDFHLKNNMSGKNCIKYVIFGMLIVVWSPCLLAVILAWIVMFPWKLTNMLKTDVTAKRTFPSNHSFKRFRKTNLRREYQKMCFESCTRIPEKKRSFMTSAASWYSRTVGVVVNSFNAVMSLLKLKKKEPTRAGSLFFPSSHPNPRKRYKLFYADNRGWVIKPLRRRTRSYTSSRVVKSMRCEFRPTFWQKLKCQNLQQASCRNVPCPMHGTESNPMYQYSPAGDGYPVQSRIPCTSCKNQEKCLQRPLNTDHRPQQEVNIPLNFFYTTSGIAPISACEAVHTKLTNTKIKNNIAYKNVVKDHHGFHKNNTLPFGVVPEDLTKHDAGNTVIKAPGVDRITALAEVSNHLPHCALHSLRRQTTKCGRPLNCLSAGSHKLAIGNKKSPSRQNKIYFSNKCVLTDLFHSTLTKQAKTSTHKVNYAHKIQNTSIHHKVTNKLKSAKTIVDLGSKCACEVKVLPPKQVYIYKTRTPAQKHPSPAKMKSSTKHDSIVNYSFGNTRKQSKQSYKDHAKPARVPPHMLSNTVEITKMTNRPVDLDNLYNRSEHTPNQISAATQMQQFTADIATSTKCNVALSYSREEDHGLFEHGDKHKPHQVPVATQMQSRTADNATSIKLHVAMNFPCEEDHKLSKHGNQPKPQQIPVATQIRLKTADITTCTNCNVATNYPNEETYMHQILVASQMQSEIAKNATNMNRNLASIRPSEYKHNLTKHSSTHELPMANQMQQTVDNATGTNLTLAFNYSDGDKLTTANKVKPCSGNTTDKETKYIQLMKLSDSDYNDLLGQIPVATQKQSNTVDATTMINCDLEMNYPYEGKYAQSEQACKYKSDHISVATQKEPSTADIKTSVKYLGGVTQSTPDNRLSQAWISRVSEKNTTCTKNTNPPEYLSKAQDESIQKHSYKIDAYTDCVSVYDTSKTKGNFLLEQTMSPYKTVDLIDATTSSEKRALEMQTDSLKKGTDYSLGGGGSRKLNASGMYKDTQTIAYSALKGEIETERPMRPVSKKIVECGIRQLPTEDLIKQFQPRANSPLFRVALDNRYDLAPQITQTSKDSSLQAKSQEFRIASDYVSGVTHVKNKPNYKMEQKTANNTNTHKTSSAKEPSNKQSQLQGALTDTVGVPEEPKLFGIASDWICGINQTKVVKRSTNKNNSTEQSKVSKESRQYGSQKSPLANCQGFKPDAVSAQFRKPSKIRTETESSPTSTDIQDLPCSCKCECICASRFKSKIPQHLPSARPGISKEDKTSSKSPKSPTHLPTKSSQKSPHFGIALDCHCGEAPPKNEPAKEFKQMKDYSKHTLTDKTGSAKEPLSKPPNRIQEPYRTVQDQSRFVIASDCTCGTNQTTAAEQNLYNNVTAETKSTIAKERKSNSQPLSKSPISKFPKSPEHSSLRKLLPLKCRFHDSVGEKPHGSKDNATSSKRNIVKVYIARSKFTNSPERSRPRRECRCPIESLQDSVDKPPYSTKFSDPTSKRNVVTVGRTTKLSDHTPPHEFLQQTYPCAVVGLQDPVGQQSPSIKVSRAFSKGNSVKVDKTRSKFEQSSKHAPPQEYLHLDCTCPVKNTQEPAVKKTSQTSRKSIFRRKSTSKSFDFPDECPCSVSQIDLKKIRINTDVPVNTKRSFKRSRESNCFVNQSYSRFQSSSISQYSTKVSSLVMSLSSKLFSRRNKTSKIGENPTKNDLPVNRSSFQVKSKEADRAVSTDILVSLEVQDESNQSLFRRCRKSKTRSNINQQSKTSEHSSIVTLFTRKTHKKIKQYAKKFDLQYSSTVSNCQPTPTVRQTVQSQLLPSQRLLKSKKSSIVKRFQPKPLLEKIPRADKISTNSLIDKQEKPHREPKVSEQSFQLRSTQPNNPKIDSFHHSYPSKLLTVKKEFEVNPLQLKANQEIPIISGCCKRAEELKITKENVSNHEQFEEIPQPPKPKEVIPIISGMYMCAGEKSNTIEKIQPNTNYSALGNEKQSKSSQHLAHQTLKSSAFKLSQLHASHQSDTPHKALIRNLQSAHKKPCNYRSFNHGNEQEFSKSLHKVVKNKRSQEKSHNSHLISHNYSATTRRLKEHIVHRSEIFQCPGVQAIQICEQKLPQQKGLSKIPSHVDKPPPELLQQHPPGLGRRSTAELEVQQPYPDFNRVSLRYGHKSPSKQSLQIPGKDGPSPANNYSPAPGATPPPHYGANPSYTNPSNRYVPQSPYDETALRRAYKRRPLRYTPSRKQLPRVVMTKKLKENQQRAAEVIRGKGTQRATGFFKCVRNLVSKTERELFPEEMTCNPIWLNTLKRKPCFCIYKLCPRLYPAFLNCYNTHKHLSQLLAYFITLCFWSPFLLCGYLCCNVCCKCCS